MELIPSKFQTNHGQQFVNYTQNNFIGDLEGHFVAAEPIAGILKAAMIEAGSEFLKKVPIEVEVVISDSWAGKL